MTDDRQGDAEAARDRALDALVAVATRLAAAETLAQATSEPALGAIAEAAVALIRATAASIALRDASTGRLVFRAAAGREGEAVVGLSVAPHEGIAGYAFSAGQALAIADVTADPRFLRATAEQTGYVPRSLLAVPLVDEAGVIGVLEVLDRLDGQPFDLRDVEVATRLAGAATAVARTSRLDHEAGRLLRTALASAAGPSLDGATIDALLTEVSARLDDEDGTWQLADRIGRLRDADPGDIDLAVAWLDALLASTERRARGTRRQRA